MKRYIGCAAFMAAMLWLTACSGTPEGAPAPSQEPQHTQEAPQSTPGTAPVDPPQQTPLQTPNPTTVQSPASSTPSAPSTEEGQPPDILEAAATVITALKEKDMDQLADWVHPERGIRFSPFAYVDTANDLVFTKDEVDTLLEDPAKRVWRLFEGTGEVIELNFADYYKWYIYDADFEQDAGIAVNKELRKEQTSGNLNEVYPEANHDFVEYYIGGLDLAEEGMDWRSLYLVFETNGDDHALVGIIHDQWTP
ncbi:MULTISPECIES: hypothetical protein [unclassified Paenibacillus]|uniref:hypothetical protein n=1 Tax=unclassified Paenibacillus TaxID=185978 RepID=UPI0004F82B14|nr:MULTISPECIES: hypothetical protein [unclassified Paenibacillus]AIQ32999.1 hypothetical protein P40081_36515 [Paenibacillus sp. FSL P4-0081]OMF28822.1 hypothetical protein BK132_12680 [Paenibacillus sp. FSL H8-0259]